MNVFSLVKKYRLHIRLVITGILTLGFGGILLFSAQAASLTSRYLTLGNPITQPVKNTHTAPVTTTVSITYNESINPTTVTTQTFAVYGMQTGLLTQTYSINGGTISLETMHPFRAGELVQVSATTQILSLVDNTGPISPTVWQFRTTTTNSSGKFANTKTPLGDSITVYVTLGDVDGDGDLDAVIGNFGQANKVWLNDGSGEFADSGQTLGTLNTMTAILGDVDGDGDLDALIGNESNQPNEVWFNNGGLQGGIQGIFSNSGQPLGNSKTRSIVLGDLDGDGDLDAFVGNFGQGDEVWLNDGHGVFTKTAQSLDTSQSYELDLGDIDNDGDLDAFVANENEPNIVWRNDGKGQFSKLATLGISRSTAIDLGDLDGDGDLDVFVGNYAESNQVWFNDGDGNLTDSGQMMGSGGSLALRLGDVDGDGDLDALVGNELSADKVWLNDGLGIFTDSEQRLLNPHTYALDLGDLDGDGDLDAFIGNYDAANIVWLNQPFRNYLPLILK